MSDNKKPTDFRARWDDLRRECEALENDNSTGGLGARDPRVLEHEAQIAANDTLRWEAAEAAWATRARDPADLLLLAEIAYDQFFDLRAFPSLPAGFEDGDNHQKIAVACLIRGIAEVARVQVPPSPHGEEEPASGMPKHRRDWLAMLRDAGPGGAAPDPRHAVIWGAILDLRGCRDAIENTVEQMTERLNRLADETTLTHAIVAGWEPEEDEPEGDAGPKPPA